MSFYVWISLAVSVCTAALGYLAGKTSPRPVPIEPPDARIKHLEWAVETANKAIEAYKTAAESREIKPLDPEKLVWVTDPAWHDREYTKTLDKAVEALKTDLVDFGATSIRLTVDLKLGIEWVRYLKGIGWSINVSESGWPSHPLCNKRFDGHGAAVVADLVDYMSQKTLSLTTASGGLAWGNASSKSPWVVRLVATVQTQQAPKLPEVRFVEVPVLVPELVPIPRYSQEDTKEAAEIAAKLEIDPALAKQVKSFLRSRVDR